MNLQEFIQNEANTYEGREILRNLQYACSRGYILQNVKYKIEGSKEIGFSIYMYHESFNHWLSLPGNWYSTQEEANNAIRIAKSFENQEIIDEFKNFAIPT